ncbi:MAG: tyrosine-type recombinase/integrase [Alphaproteobacteria bacterium]
MLRTENLKNWFIDYLRKVIKTDSYTEEEAKIVKKIISKHKKGEKIDFKDLYEPLMRVKKYQIEMEKSRLDKKTIEEADKIEKLQKRGMKISNRVFGLAKDALENDIFYEALVMNSDYKPTKEIELLLETIKSDKIKERDATKVLLQKKKYTIAECIEDYLEPKILRGVDDKIIKSNRNKLKRMFSVVKIKYIHEIKQEECEKIEKETYKFLIPNGTRPLVSKTVREYLVVFKVFLKFFRQKRRIDDDFNEFIDLPPKSKGEKKRRNYSDKEIQKLFNFPSYLQQRYNPKYFQRFWVPLIALYTGARLNEICQLEICDIIKVDGIYCFDMVDEEVDIRKSLKTVKAKRRIPIHKKLIEIGFIKFYEKVKNCPTIRKRWYKKHNKKIEMKHFGKIKLVDNCSPENLFFTILYTTSNKYGGGLSKWFGKMRRKAFTVKKKGSLVFHSFRHTLGSNMSKNEAAESRIINISGWVNKGMEGNYLKHDVASYKKDIDKATYSLLENDLSKLMPDPEKEKNFLKV